MSQHIEWLNLIDRSGAFLEPGVLDDALPQGLEGVDSERRRNLLSAYDEWREAVDACDADAEALHRAWIDFVLKEFLEYEDRVLLRGEFVPESLSLSVAEHGGIVRPGMAVMKGDSPQLLIDVLPPDTDLESIRSYEGWNTSALDRMIALCRGAKVTIGLVTNGERWLVVHVPEGGTVGHASWYGRIWRPEPVTLRAFQTLLGVRRCFGPQEKTLPALLSASLEYQDEVTDTLGQQVRRAVEVLIQSLDRADHDRHDELLRDVEPRELYEAGLTVMMRLVFLMCAEERGLLLLGEGIYDQNYAISTLRSELREWQSRHGDQVLERRHDAWSRLLATFRAVFGGVAHETLRMPALGGSLFDPDRFPFLEGRPTGSSWRQSVATPLPIDNRTVLLLLSSLQVLEQRQGARLLSYKALDVEQIGHVYEGLLECTVQRLPEITLGLEGASSAKDPNVSLLDLERTQREGEAFVLALLTEVTGRSESALRRAMTRDVDEAFESRLLLACGSDTGLLRRVKPWANLLRKDIWDHPLVYRKDAFAVTLGSDRRETGTHYTPKSLTERIVRTTLEPLVYGGPSDGKPREAWILKTPHELLDLKVCDPAMGSGAFLVQVCRYLGDRVAESWILEEASGKAITVDGEVIESLGSSESVPTDPEERVILARRLVAERCLYGVDINPMAVELAKLSIWLVTLAKGRPFGFLDHNLRCGDSLLGTHHLDQITDLTMDHSRDRQPHLFGQSIRTIVNEALHFRLEIRKIPVRDLNDINAKAKRYSQAREIVEAAEQIADALVGEALRTAGSDSAQRSALEELAREAQRMLDGENEGRQAVIHRAYTNLTVDCPPEKPIRTPFHWSLEFPEVFERENGGFDAIVGNPPFLGGQKISGVLGSSYRNYLVAHLAGGQRGSADLVAYFFLRSYSLIRMGGDIGLLAVNTIAEGDSREVGLESLLTNGAVIYAAYPNEPWPGVAAVVTSRVHMHKGSWQGTRLLQGNAVPFVSAFLTNRDDWTPRRLKANDGKSFQGSITLGMGFVLTQSEAREMLDADPCNGEVIFPYLNGEDLNSDPEQRPSRWVICFWDWPEEKARQFKLPWLWIEERVKPERQRCNQSGEFVLRRPLPQRWWQFAEKRPALYHSIGRGHLFERHPSNWDTQTAPKTKIIAFATQASKYPGFSLISNHSIFSNAVGVIATDNPARLMELSSSFHAHWAFTFGGRLETRLRYAPTDCFETFPFLDDVDSQLINLGELFHNERLKLLIELNIGLTQLYNRFHNFLDNDEKIEKLRGIQIKIDQLIANNYGWNDLDLAHGFHKIHYLPENDQIRFTISDSVWVEALRRLSELNRERYQDEIARGLQRPPRLLRGGREMLQPQIPFSNPGLNFDESGQEGPGAGPTALLRSNPGPNPLELNPASAILNLLRGNTGWHAKSDVTAATGLTDSQWNAGIGDLVARGLVERQGERRSARYRGIGV
ncbi:Eco57I restriction-modification methylase domain-containing protein [Geothrix mesophila]|uniref:Eco57I restriction-modification methylase domain-containing protein n=1 Tax=Geothrix mesophila TaxID=2922723 RepID=UPI001FAD259A|nr:type IIL restriction-modification enzyme MmeI [Geothrix sp. SG198]